MTSKDIGTIIMTGRISGKAADVLGGGSLQPVQCAIMPLFFESWPNLAGGTVRRDRATRTPKPTARQANWPLTVHALG